MSGHFWLTDEQMERLRPFFPKSRDKPRVDDRRVLSGIIYIKKNGLQWKGAPSLRSTQDALQPVRPLVAHGSVCPDIHGACPAGA
jgi:transposase